MSKCLTCNRPAKFREVPPTSRTFCGKECQLVAGMMEKEGRYRDNTGKYQADHDALVKRLEEIAKASPNGQIDWNARKNRYWALFNGALGLYNGWYNDGDTAEEAIDNNRFQGFQTVQAVKRLANELGAEKMKAYIKIRIDGKNPYLMLRTMPNVQGNLEEMMDEAILILKKNL